MGLSKKSNFLLDRAPQKSVNLRFIQPFSLRASSSRTLACRRTVEDSSLPFKRDLSIFLFRQASQLEVTNCDFK
jgi:hypothetical protein